MLHIVEAKEENMKNQRRVIWRTHLPSGCGNDPKNHAIDVSFHDGSVITSCGHVFRKGWTTELEVEDDGSLTWDDCKHCLKITANDEKVARDLLSITGGVP